MATSRIEPVLLPEEVAELVVVLSVVGTGGALKVPTGRESLFVAREGSRRPAWPLILKNDDIFFYNGMLVMCYAKEDMENQPRRPSHLWRSWG